MNEGGHFSLSVRADERDALITVVDDGAGIALARRPGERAYAVRIPLEGAARKANTPPAT